MCPPDSRVRSAVPESRFPGSLAGRRRGMSVKLPPSPRAAGAVPSSWTRVRSRLMSPRSGCTWPRRARRPGRSGSTPRRRAGSPPPTCSARRIRPGGSRWTAGRAAVDQYGCWATTAGRTRASSTVAAAVLPVAGRRGRASRPDGQAARAHGEDTPVPVFTSVELSGLREGLPGRHVRAAPRRRDPRRCSWPPASG